VLEQYELTVKPSFNSYIQPTKRHADLVLPRGAENTLAIDVLLLQHVRFKLHQQRGVGESQRRDLVLTDADTLIRTRRGHSACHPPRFPWCRAAAAKMPG